MLGMHSRFELMNAKFYVMLALAERPMNGVAVQEQIVGDTVGKYVRASTVYAVLRRLVRDGLAECDEGRLRKQYWLIDEGRRILRMEMRTLGWVLKEAQKRAG